ncbi:MAG: hypothetical protein NWS99_00655, partial [Paracoccaceae bacterium]|nr:hypothetical protein [Paracoccaceae bacterium]
QPIHAKNKVMTFYTAPIAASSLSIKGRNQMRAKPQNMSFVTKGFWGDSQSNNRRISPCNRPPL